VRKYSQVVHFRYPRGPSFLRESSRQVKEASMSESTKPFLILLCPHASRLGRQEWAIRLSLRPEFSLFEFPQGRGIDLQYAPRTEQEQQRREETYPPSPPKPLWLGIHLAMKRIAKQIEASAVYCLAFFLLQGNRPTGESGRWNGREQWRESRQECERGQDPDRSSAPD
jgi:hypothetical protein